MAKTRKRQKTKLAKSRRAGISFAALIKGRERKIPRHRIYLDHAATTPVRKEVLQEMLPYFSDKYGNASSLHSFGREAAQAMEQSRVVIARSIGASPDEIIFTSGGTESDNLAIKGLAFANGRKSGHIITSLIEHPAVMATCRFLEKRGFKVTYLPVDSDGQVSVADVRSNITDETFLVTIMHANNEIGTIQPIEGIARICKEKGVLFHTDAVQTFCKLPIDVRKMGIDMMSLSGHKIYAPKGVGALYVKSGIKLEPIAHGGPHEMERRAGTENVAGIVGFATAAQLALKEMPKEMKRQARLRDIIIEQVSETVKGSKLNGSARNRLPN
ncbi:MAG: cysteine desulfurase family protein, partial [Candidatus Micrarchaeia archaeon]